MKCIVLVTAAAMFGLTGVAQAGDYAMQSTLYNDLSPYAAASQLRVYSRQQPANPRVADSQEARSQGDDGRAPRPEIPAVAEEPYTPPRHVGQH